MFRDFYYVSAQKVASYAAQIPAGAAESLGAELTASLGVLSAKIKTLDPRNDLISRLQLVCDFIEAREELGTSEYPGKWVKDRLLVRHIRMDRNPEVFLLLGENSAGELCALFGSAKHVLGARQTESVGVGLSYFPDFADLILGEIERLDAPDYKLDVRQQISSGQLVSGGCQDSEVCHILSGLHSNATGFPFEVTFLGRYVFEGQSTLASPACKAFAPIYVCLEDGV